jgi:hypothetical protein
MLTQAPTLKAGLCIDALGTGLLRWTLPVLAALPIWEECYVWTNCHIPRCTALCWMPRGSQPKKYSCPSNTICHDFSQPSVVSWEDHEVIGSANGEESLCLVSQISWTEKKKWGFFCLFVCLFCGGAKTEYTAHSFLPPLSGFSGWGLMKEHPCLLN